MISGSEAAEAMAGVLADVASLSPVGGMMSSQRGFSMLSKEGDEELLSMQSGKGQSETEESMRLEALDCR